MNKEGNYKISKKIAELHWWGDLHDNLILITELINKYKLVIITNKFLKLMLQSLASSEQRQWHTAISFSGRQHAFTL